MGALAVDMIFFFLAIFFIVEVLLTDALVGLNYVW